MLALLFSFIIFINYFTFKFPIMIQEHLLSVKLWINLIIYYHWVFISVHKHDLHFHNVLHILGNTTNTILCYHFENKYIIYFYLIFDYLKNINLNLDSNFLVNVLDSVSPSITSCVVTLWLIIISPIVHKNFVCYY